MHKHIYHSKTYDENIAKQHFAYQNIYIRQLNYLAELLRINPKFVCTAVLHDNSNNILYIGVNFLGGEAHKLIDNDLQDEIQERLGIAFKIIVDNYLNPDKKFFNNSDINDFLTQIGHNLDKLSKRPKQDLPVCAKKVLQD